MSAAEKIKTSPLATNDAPLELVEHAPQTSNRLTWMIVILATAGLVTGALSYYWFSYLERYCSTDDAYAESDLYPVNSRIMGYVDAVNVAEGESVKQGQILATMDENDLAFEHSFKEMKFKKAELDYNRANTLHKSTAISDYDLENAEAAMKTAEADLKTTEIKMKYSKVISPATGVVAKRTMQVGQYVQPGQVLFVVVDDQKPWIKANFKETQVTNMKPNQSVVIELDGYPHVKFSGHVEMVFPSSGAKLSLLPPENATGNFTRIVQRIPVKIAFDHRDQGLSDTVGNVGPGDGRHPRTSGVRNR